MKALTALLLVLVASTVAADSLCWIQPGGNTTSWQVETNTQDLSGTEEQRADGAWCAEFQRPPVPFAWDVWALQPPWAPVKSANGPKFRLPEACRLDLSSNGVIDMPDVGRALLTLSLLDVGRILTALGTACQ